MQASSLRLCSAQLGVDGGAEDPSLRPFWRGRMGLSKEEQLELYEQVGCSRSALPSVGALLGA